MTLRRASEHQAEINRGVKNKRGTLLNVGEKKTPNSSFVDQK